MNIDAKIIGKRVKEIRKIRKMSQMLLAEKCEISDAYLSYIECGKKNEGEAMIQMHQMRCGYCLKKVSEDGVIYSLYDMSYTFKNENHVKINEMDAIIADYFLCDECFKELLDKIDENAGNEQRKYIEEHKSEESWHYKDWRRPWEIDD